MTTTKIVILHGNHGTTADDAWYASLKDRLVAAGYTVDLRTHPETTINSRENVIQMLQSSQVDDRTILIGHSSGALACMRYAERFPVLGLVLVTPYVTHMGNPHEKESGYFDFRWNPESMRQNTEWIIQFSSDADPFISYKEQSQVIRRMLRTPGFDYSYYKCIDMHHIGKKYKSAHFIFDIVHAKITSQFVNNMLTSSEVDEFGELVEVHIEKVNNGDEEEPIEIAADHLFVQSWKDSILPEGVDLNLSFGEY
jgi:predicted alpha/beta hydrolase family esterase